jgi:hypothetical protein
LLGTAHGAHPSPPLEAAQRDVDALPGASRLMRQFLLNQSGLGREGGRAAIESHTELKTVLLPFTDEMM